MKYKFIRLCVIFAAFLLAACRQDRDQPEELLRQQRLNAQLFLTLPQNPDEGIVKIAGELAEQNKLHGFIPDFIQNYGYAAWEHALKAEGAAAANWYVPLTGENSVNAFIHCVMAKGQIRFRLITPYNIARILESIPEG
ncbi:MAG: hypothetical protein LBL90_02380, partial [Prevotellaceae bacterium]|nr:hypothetical protein [Prevotellaceae bacterium]